MSERPAIRRAWRPPRRRGVNTPPATADATAPPRRRRIGLLGGSFDPAHEGHLHISRDALRRYRLDEVWWLVSPQNPLKRRASASLDARLKAAAAIARGDGRIRATDLERRIGARFSCETIARLRRREDANFLWLMGADNLAQIRHWRRWRAIFGAVPIAVFDRSPYSHGALTGAAAQSFAGARVNDAEAGRLADMTAPAWHFARLRPHPASSTAIRAARERAAR